MNTLQQLTEIVSALPEHLAAEVLDAALLRGLWRSGNGVLSAQVLQEFFYALYSRSVGQAREGRAGGPGQKPRAQSGERSERDTCDGAHAACSSAVR
jgi:hypothetical protein